MFILDSYMRILCLVCLLHTFASSPIRVAQSGTAVQVDDEAEANELSTLLKEASEHVLEQFIKDSMWRPKYRTMDPDKRKLIEVRLKIILAEHILKESRAQKSSLCDEPTDNAGTSDDFDVSESSDGFVLVAVVSTDIAPADNSSAQMSSTELTDSFEDF